MPESTFHDLPILGELGVALEAAMAREAEAEAAAHATVADEPDSSAVRSRRRFPNPFRTFAIALLFAGLGTSAAAATLTVLRGSPIPVPRPADVQPEMTPAVGTSRVLDLRAADPSGQGSPFTLRTSRSESGLTCVSVGQLQDGRFGVTGTDGIFRDLPAAVIDGCGQPADDAPAVLGARIFDAPELEDVRTVAYGYAGPALRAASAEVRGRWQPARTIGDGAFVVVLRDYPEDLGLRVKLEYDDGRTSVHPLGVGAFTILDPTGPAWSAQAGSVSTYTGLCIGLGPARYRPTGPRAPQVCGRTRGPRDGRPSEAYFFTTRTLRPGQRGKSGPLGSWDWHQNPSRTMVYGFADLKAVTALRVLGGPQPVRPHRLANGAFAAIYPGSVDASRLRVQLTMKDGSTRTERGAVNVIVPRKERSR